MVHRTRVLLAAWMSIASLASACAEDCPKCPTDSSAASAPMPSVSVAPAERSAPAAAPAATAVELRFGGKDRAERKVSIASLIAAVAPQIVEQYDPYYNRVKRYRALPLARVLEIGFEGTSDLASREFVLRALDGYTVPMRGSKAFEPGAYVAFEDLEVPAWEPIGQQRANPAPLYLVWSEKHQTNLETHPRPYQLAAVELARFEDVFPRTVPAGLEPESPAWRGFALFREQCIHCHAINRQGGRVGPELNVPRSIVEYRPVDQIRAYIRNPLSFRYSTMPAHEGFGDAELDGLVAYFTAMKDRKQDDAPKPNSP